ncbi:branched-chain amino acid transport system II carrier protein [Streptobacillus canis]|uniref:branched-chain amino acid transport system II carrier protein n=1 Tax=Streptobacillus canis TaxID=2678686 RepID=UPI0012E28CCD|nr:branched-chain amino acid transport system II carrier protein [Streptobacillus canis]
MEKLSKKDFRHMSVMIFGLFFGAGNLIFPPFLGKEAGTNSLISLFFFSFTAIIFPVLGIIAVSKFDGIKKLSNMVGPLFALIFTTAIYITIGPGLAIPRNATVSFEIAMTPFITNVQYMIYFRIAYTLIFFGVVYYLSMKPSKLVTTLGKILTPTLLILIVVMFIGVVINPFNPSMPVGDYVTGPAVKGFLEGYNTMDTLGALNYGIVIAFTIRNLGIKDEKNVTEITMKTGTVSSIILLIVYGMLTYIGAATANLFPNTKTGAEILVNVVKMNYGIFGSLILGGIFIIACLSVAIGLTTSISQYFNEIYPKISYRSWVILYTVVSFILAIFGLENILKYSIPILLSIYPVSLVLILLGLFSEYFGNSKMVFKSTIYVTAIFSIGMVLNGLINNVLDPVFNLLPFNGVSLGWVLPSMLAFVISVILHKVKKNG